MGTKCVWSFQLLQLGCHFSLGNEDSRPDLPAKQKGAMSKDLYIEISAHFGIESVENLVVNAEIVLLTDMAKQTIIYVKCCADWFVCLSVFLFIAFV